MFPQNEWSTGRQVLVLYRPFQVEGGLWALLRHLWVGLGDCWARGMFHPERVLQAHQCLGERTMTGTPKPFAVPRAFRSSAYKPWAFVPYTATATAGHWCLELTVQ